jgi:hypothetical protein
MKTIVKGYSKEKVLNEISDGQICTITFVKKNGDVRVMNGRVGVKKGVKGVGHKFNPADKGLLQFFDIQIQQHRFVNINTLLSVKANGILFKDFN